MGKNTPELIKHHCDQSSIVDFLDKECSGLTEKVLNKVKKILTKPKGKKILKYNFGKLKPAERFEIFKLAFSGELEETQKKSKESKNTTSKYIVYLDTIVGKEIPVFDNYRFKPIEVDDDGKQLNTEHKLYSGSTFMVEDIDSIKIINKNGNEKRNYHIYISIDDQDLLLLGYSQFKRLVRHVIGETEYRICFDINESDNTIGYGDTIDKRSKEDASKVAIGDYPKIGKKLRKHIWEKRKKKYFLSSQ